MLLGNQVCLQSCQALETTARLSRIVLVLQLAGILSIDYEGCDQTPACEAHMIF